MQLELARRRTALGELGREQLVAQVKVHVELGRLKWKTYFFFFCFGREQYITKVKIIQTRLRLSRLGQDYSLSLAGSFHFFSFSELEGFKWNFYFFFYSPFFGRDQFVAH